MNALRGIGLTNDLSKRKVKVYNVMTKTLAMECNSVAEASAFTGLDRKRVAAYIRDKSRYSSEKLGLIVAFR